MNVGVQLRVYRKSKGHSVQKVSELTGISADKLYKWEKGTRPSDAEDLLKIREYMSGKIGNGQEGLESRPIKDDIVNQQGSTEQEYQKAYNRALAGYVTLDDHIALLKQWRQDAESKYQDSHKANMALIDLLKSELAKIAANLAQGQHEIKEQMAVLGDDLINQLDGISSGLAAAVKTDKGVSAQVPKSAKGNKDR